MPTLTANGITLGYEEHGNPRDPALLLIMGLGMQLTAWPDEFCNALASRGFRVLRYDNRDTGLSTKFPQPRPMDLGAVLGRALTGQKIDAPYTLDDMAADAVGLLDALRIDRAHVVGASMGGAIAQLVGANHTARLHSLVSVMSTSGNPALPPARPEALKALLAPRPDAGDREAVIRHSMSVQRAIGSPGFPISEPDLRARIERSIDRCYHPEGIARQFAAILASGHRMELLPRIKVPTLVLHGVDDPLVPIEAGRETAALIPGARLHEIPGMGHDLAPGTIPILVDAIAHHCKMAASGI